MEKIKIDKVIVVEGKYDKIKLSSFVDGYILTTDGFSLFNNKDKCDLIRSFAKTKGIIILTDSDGAGFVIRNKIKGIVGKDSNIINLYAPQILGKEKRKSAPSKQGYLGVEGVEQKILRQIFEKTGLIAGQQITKSDYNKTDLYDLGFCGQENSSVKRDEFCKSNGLPSGMSANAFLDAINILGLKIN